MYNTGLILLCKPETHLKRLGNMETNLILSSVLLFFTKISRTNGLCQLSSWKIEDQVYQYYQNNFCNQPKRNKRSTYSLISQSHDDTYSQFDRYLNLSGNDLMNEIENELETAFDKNLNISITEALLKEANGKLEIVSKYLCWF